MSEPRGEWSLSPYYSGLARVISTRPFQVTTRVWSDGLEFRTSGHPLTISRRAVDADCPAGRTVQEYRLGFVYWLAHRLGVLRPGIVDPPTFAELKRHVYVDAPLTDMPIG